jgi:hypothetical protein
MSRSWLIRLGKFGEQESHALETGELATGWIIGDLMTAHTREAIYEAVERAYPNEKSGTIKNWAVQLNQLRNEITEGDLTITPMKTKGQVAIGRVTGGFHQTSEGRPARRVEWLRTDLPRDAIKQDLVYSLGSTGGAPACCLRRGTRLGQKATRGRMAESQSTVEKQAVYRRRCLLTITAGASYGGAYSGKVPNKEETMKVVRRYATAARLADGNPIIQIVGPSGSKMFVVFNGKPTVEDIAKTEIAVLRQGRYCGHITVRGLDRLGNADRAQVGQPVPYEAFPVASVDQLKLRTSPKDERNIIDERLPTVKKAVSILLRDWESESVDLTLPIGYNWERIERFLAILPENDLVSLAIGAPEGSNRILDSHPVEGDYAMCAMAEVFEQYIGTRTSH